MPVYAVFEPPIRRRGDRIDRDRTDRFVFLREGFNLWAFLFGPLYDFFALHNGFGFGKLDRCGCREEISSTP